MLKRILISAALMATPAVAQQQQATAVNGGLVMHVGVNPDRSTRVSLGMLRVDSTGGTIVQRRELAAQCQWIPSPDLPVQPGDVSPISAPPSARTPEQFGVYVATLYSATATAKGGEPTAEEHGCIRALITAMTASAIQRHQQSAPPPQPQQ